MCNINDNKIEILNIKEFTDIVNSIVRRNVKSEEHKMFLKIIISSKKMTANQKIYKLERSAIFYRNHNIQYDLQFKRDEEKIRSLHVEWEMTRFMMNCIYKLYEPLKSHYNLLNEMLKIIDSPILPFDAQMVSLSGVLRHLS